MLQASTFTPETPELCSSIHCSHSVDWQWSSAPPGGLVVLVFGLDRASPASPGPLFERTGLQLGWAGRTWDHSIQYFKYTSKNRVVFRNIYVYIYIYKWLLKELQTC